MAPLFHSVLVALGAVACLNSLSPSLSISPVYVEAYSKDSLQDRVVTPFRKVGAWFKEEGEYIKSSLYNHTHLTKEQYAEVESIVGNIAKLSESLVEEEDKVHLLHLHRADLAYKHPLWMFDQALSEKHRQMSHDIAHEERKLFGIQDEVHMEMVKIKGIIGIYSTMFVVDLVMTLLSPLISTFQFVLNTFFSSFLLFFLVFFPLLFTTMLFFLELRQAIVPVYMVIHLFMVALELPGVVLQYHPQAWEFALILIPSLQLMAFIASKVFLPKYLIVDMVKAKVE